MAKKKIAAKAFKMDKQKTLKYIGMVKEGLLHEAPDSATAEKAREFLNVTDQWYPIAVLAEFSPSVFRRGGDGEVMLAMRRTAPAFYDVLSKQ